jgi:hypothetical protein
MMWILAGLLLPLHFTAPTDTLGADGSGRAVVSPDPVRSYLFHRLDVNGTMVSVPGYADSTGSAILRPHPPGTRETVWLSQGSSGKPVTIYVMSRDRRGNLSAPSNGCVLGEGVSAQPLALRRVLRNALEVPIVQQARERCGQAALEMVLRYYGASPEALRELDAAYDPVLRGSLITDLAGAARRAGYSADVATLTPALLIELLHEGVPTILLYQNGAGPLTVRHFGVVTQWDAGRGEFTLNDGGPRPRVAHRGDLVKRWETAGSQALVVRRSEP